MTWDCHSNPPTRNRVCTILHGCQMKKSCWSYDLMKASGLCVFFLSFFFFSVLKELVSQGLGRWAMFVPQRLGQEACLFERACVVRDQLENDLPGTCTGCIWKGKPLCIVHLKSVSVLRKGQHLLVLAVNVLLLLTVFNQKGKLRVEKVSLPRLYKKTPLC